MLLIDQPEQFYTINLTLGFFYKNISVVFIVGGLLVLSALLYIFLEKKTRNKKISNNFVIIILLIFWIPLYINYFYNNLYDSYENFSIRKYNNEKKSIVRICNIDSRGNFGGLVCQIFSFLRYSKNILPESSLVKIISANPLLDTYLKYYAFPYFKITNSFEDADYVLYYYNREYEYKDGALFAAGLGDKIGDYELVGNIGLGRLILKK